MGIFGCCGKSSTEKKPKSLQKRSCTDVLCLIIFIAFLGVLLFICGLAFYAGDWASLIYSADYTGQRCGVGVHAGKPKAFYPRLPRDFIEQRSIVETGDVWNLKLYALCVKECPTTFNIDDPSAGLIDDYGYDKSTALTQAFMPYTQKQWLSPTPTLDIANRCIPMKSSDQTEESMCAFPKCDSAEAIAVGAVCANTTIFNSGQWAVCAGGESGSGSAAADCAAQQETCQVRATHTTTMVHELATSDDESASLLSSVTSLVGGVHEIMASIAAAAPFIVVGGFVLPLLIAFLYMGFLFCFAKTVIYGLLIILILCQLVATLVCFSRSGLSISGVSGDDLITEAQAASNVTVPSYALTALETVNEDSQWIYTIAFVVLAIVTVITILTVILARKKIAICAAIVKEATTVFASMPLLMFFPTWSVIGQIVVCLWFVGTMALVQTTSPESLDVALGKVANETIVAAAGATLVEEVNVDPIASVRTLVENPWYTNGTIVVCLFGFFVLLQFVQGVAWCTMSGATYYWYFFRDASKYEGDETTRIPITRSLGRVLFYHSGSVAFAAFIIAICDMLRAVAAYIEKQMEASGTTNFLVKLAFKVLQCCLYCLKKTIKFVSYYGLVFVSCQGSSFCMACYKTFFFFVQNPGQVSINATVVTLLRLVAILSSPVGCAVLFYLLIDALPHEQYADNYNPMYPTICIYVCAAVMTTSCMVVFECVITTVFVCCFQDKAEFNSKYMSERLAKAFGIKREKPGEKAEAEEDKPVQSL